MVPYTCENAHEYSESVSKALLAAESRMFRHRSVEDVEELQDGPLFEVRQSGNVFDSRDPERSVEVGGPVLLWGVAAAVVREERYELAHGATKLALIPHTTASAELELVGGGVV